jgi:hypothetical protein
MRATEVTTRAAAAADLHNERRRQVPAEPGFYSPWLHLGTTLVSGLLVIVASALALQGVRWWELAFAAAVFVIASALEWCVHRFAMHCPGRSPGLYQRHAMLHHVVYRRDDMAIRAASELRIVLLKPWVVPGVTVALTPTLLVLTWAGQRNLAALLALVAVSYILLYEGLHLMCHLPLRSPFAAWPLLAWLRHHHALHHDPQWMRTWNFNIAVPLWDLLLGTLRRAPEGRDDPGCT